MPSQLKHRRVEVTTLIKMFRCFTGNNNKDLPMQLLCKTESVEVHQRHGNPFSDDGSNEERHDKSPLLIGSADSSYNMDTPHR